MSYVQVQWYSYIQCASLAPELKHISYRVCHAMKITIAKSILDIQPLRPDVFGQRQ